MLKSTWCWMIVLLLLSAAAPAAETVVIDGVSHVRNGSRPAEARQDLHLEEIWRVGGEDEDVLFGAPGTALADEDGNVYVMDSQLSEVKVISPTGELARLLGREGDGPGEIRRMGNIFFLPGGELAMMQTFPGLIKTIHTDGTPGREFHFRADDAPEGTFGVLTAGSHRGGTFILTGMLMALENQINTQRYYLSRCDNDGRELHRFFSKEYAINYADFVGDEIGLDFVWGRWALDDAGRLYAAPDRDEYKIQVIDPDGTTIRIIEREYETYVRTDEEKELTRLYVEATFRNHPVPPRECTVEETEPSIARLQTMPDGELWVMTSRGTRNLPDGIGMIYDAFDREGRFVRQVAVHGSFDTDRDLVRWLGDGRFVVIAGAGEGYLNAMGVSSGEEVPPVEVICYRIVE